MDNYIIVLMICRGYHASNTCICKYMFYICTINNIFFFVAASCDNALRLLSNPNRLLWDKTEDYIDLLTTILVGNLCYPISQYE